MKARGRPKGSKNLAPSRHDQRRLIDSLRERAENGNAEAAGFLVLAGMLKSIKDDLRSNHE